MTVMEIVATSAALGLGLAAVVNLASLAAGAHFIGHAVNRLAKAVEESRRQR